MIPLKVKQQMLESKVQMRNKRHRHQLQLSMLTAQKMSSDRCKTKRISNKSNSLSFRTSKVSPM